MTKAGEYQKNWRAKNPDYARDYYKKNKKRLLQKSKERYQELKIKKAVNEKP